VLIISRGTNVLPIDSPTVNGQPAQSERAEGVGWQMLRISCSSLSGAVKIVAPIAQQSVPFVFSPPALEAWLLASLPLPIAPPSSLPGSKPASTTTASSQQAPASSRTATGPATTISAVAATTQSTQPTTSTAAAKPALSPERPLPRPYQPEMVRQSYCLLAPTPPGPPWTPSAAIKPEELSKIKAARLRVELCDVDGGAYANKHILLNGQQLCQIPPNTGLMSIWQEQIIDLPPDWLKRVAMTNEIQFTNPPHDLFKLRGVALAVQTADGRWITSSLAGQTYSSSRNWSYAEGEIFEGDASPKIKVSFQAPK
jgi:hypothetical protein